MASPRRRPILGESSGAAAGVADGDGAGVVGEGEAGHGAHLVGAFGGHDDHVGDAAQVGKVEDAVVRPAVVADEAGAVQEEADGQMLQGDIVDDRVVGALQERRVDGADGLHALGGQAGGEGDGVLLGDADIEEALRVELLELAQAGAVGHGGGDADDLIVGLRQVVQGLGEGLGVGDARRLGLHPAVVGAELRQAVVGAAVGLGVGDALALDGQDVDQDRAFEALDVPEGVEQALDVVAVHRADVGEAHLLEEQAGVGGGGEVGRRVFGGLGGLVDLVAADGQAA